MESLAVMATASLNASVGTEETVGDTHESGAGMRRDGSNSDKVTTPAATGITDEELQGRTRLESINSIDVAVVSKKDLLRERDQPVIEDESLRSPIQFLPGEILRRIGRSAYGDIIMLTTYRLFITYSKSFVNIPLRLIEFVSCVDVDSISATCKDGTVRSCKLASSDACFRWLHAIKQELAYLQSFADYFAVAFSITASGEKYTPWELNCENPYKLGEELRRLGFNLKTTWRITNINENYKYCSSYPKENVVPKDFPEEALEKAAPFRALCRFPSVVWRNKESGTVLLRSSQPEVGVFCQRSTEDENLIQAILSTCEKSDKMLIVDARPFSSAIANRAKGGGTEYSDYYKNCDIEFMNLPNIHSVRTSFAAVRTLMSSKDNTTRASWYSSLESSNWITNLSILLSAAMRVADTLDTKPVLVHCSDGWDRTPQICSLAQLILDPYYRTFKGFQVLIIKEWLTFGHKFAHRCGHALGEAAPHEVSPIFLQWLDAVYQLTRQFPTAFQFNEACLIKLVHHTYSCMFGTFLCNSPGVKEREEFSRDTVEVWSLLDCLQLQLSNILYTPGAHKSLEVSSHPSDLCLWTSVYSPQTSHTSGSDVTIEEGRGLQRSRSYTDISSSTESNLHQLPVVRTLSDPDLSSSLNTGDENPNSSIPQPAAAAASSDPTALLAGTSPSFVKLYNESRSRNNSGASTKELEAPRRETKDDKDNGDKDVILYDKYLDIDGLTFNVNLTRQKMVEISSSYEKQITELRRQIQNLQNKPPHFTAGECNNCHGLPIAKRKITCDDNIPGSAGSNCSDQSDSSWESVSTREPTVQLWIPDHAVSHCSLCNVSFTMYRRKHHCRQCGQIFCISCAEGFISIPQQQLFEPVRVCRTCHKNLSSAKKSLNEQLNKEATDILDDALDEPTNVNSATMAANEYSTTPAEHVSGTDSGVTRPLPIPVRQGPISDPLSLGPTVSSTPRSTRSRDGVSVGNASASTPSPQKTCSQESINTDSCVDGMQLMGAKV